MDGDSASPGVILDVEAALARLGGDKELFAELAGMLLEDVPQLFAQLRDAVNANNAPAVRMHAHALKGLLAGCGGVRAAEAAQLLEDAGQAADLSRAADLLDSLSAEIERLTQALAPYLG